MGRYRTADKSRAKYDCEVCKKDRGFVYTVPEGHGKRVRVCPACMKDFKPKS